ncbi:MAG: metal ABC transporter substrate-binding protein [Chloroflexota bacterium]
MRRIGFFLWVGLWMVWLVGCGGGEETAVSPPQLTTTTNLTLPTLTPVALDGGKLRVVATTSIIGDVVAQVGGEAIELTTLMAAGQDPHSYQPGAGDLTAVANAHIIFINGWNLEEGLLDDLANIAEDAPLVPVSAGIEPLPINADADEHDHQAEADHADAEEHGHGAADPHVWFDPDHVETWVRNIEQILSQLDPANGDSYATNAADYVAQLEELAGYMNSQVASIPTENRVLVTNHDALGYFAHRYRFEVLGTVIPAASTLAEPSATELAALVRAMEAAKVCVLFAETTASGQLETAVASELDTCETVQILTLYTGAIGPVGSGADSYIGMMQANVETLVAGLQ